MSANNWNTNSRYNALHLSKKLVPIIKALADAGLLDFAQGSYAGPGAKGNRTARIRASETLQAMFREVKFVRDDISRFEGAEIIILRDAKDAHKRGKEVDYEDNDSTIAMRKELQAYNDLLTSSFIDIATLQKPVIQTAEGIEASRVHIHHDNARTRRVFSRSNWEMNGRFYGGWWQRINDDWRSRIFIDDQPTIEVDFKGLHVAMLYAKAGHKMQDDPYHISREKFLGYPREMVRMIVKRLALTAINAKDKSSAYKAFREGGSNDFEKRITNTHLDDFLEEFVDLNPVLSDFLFSDQGIHLMYLDSQITAHIHRHFTEQGVPVLSIHDSYIIDHMKVGELRRVMAEASEAVVGHALPTAIKLPDMPEYADVSDEELQQHIENRKGIRCEGYMERMLAYEVRTGRKVSPI